MDNVDSNWADFDRALIAAAFSIAGDRGWRHLRVADAARAAGLDLARARGRYPGRGAVLLRFGRIADQAALAGATSDGAVKDRLFDLLMRRIDVLQAHRAGVLALLRALPTDPPLAALLTLANLRSMYWMLDGAGVDASGTLGLLRAKGLLAVWLWTLRIWQRDSSEDLSATMAALDQALTKAGQAEAWLRPRRRKSTPHTEPEPPAQDDDVTVPQ